MRSRSCGILAASFGACLLALSMHYADYQRSLGAVKEFDAELQAHLQSDELDDPTKADLLAQHLSKTCALNRGKVQAATHQELKQKFLLFAERLYRGFAEALRAAGIAEVALGRFGAEMRVELVNDGPFTIWLDTEDGRRPS